MHNTPIRIHALKLRKLDINRLYPVNCVRITWKNITVLGSCQVYDESISYQIVFTR